MDARTTSSVNEPVRPARQRSAVIVGFPTGLGEALANFLTSRGFDVRTLPSFSVVAMAPADAAFDLVVVSGRKSPDTVIGLAERLGARRTTRIVVLLPTNDPELQRRYRDGGIHWVLTMPVNPEAIAAAATS